MDPLESADPLENIEVVAHSSSRYGLLGEGGQIDNGLFSLSKRRLYISILSKVDDRTDLSKSTAPPCLNPFPP